VSDEANFLGLDKASLGLTRVAVDTWEGFVFINLDSHPAENLHEYLGEFGTTFDGYPFAELASTQFFWRTEIKANWKIVKDAFQEVWHIPFLHHKTIFYKPSNPYGSLMGFKLYGRHGKIHPLRRKTSPNGEEKRPQTRVESLSLRYGSGPVHRDKSVTGGGSTSPRRSPEFVLGGSSIFPNLLLYIGDQTYLTHTFWPLTENRTLWEVKYYYPKAKTLAERFAQEYHKVILRDINMEDGSTLERTQAMLASGAKREIILQDQELLIRHHHKVAESFLHD
jgi:glycine betaine catabolism A